ncbi:MAG: hypothetical protein ACE5HC_06725 [Candidatus Binatia bacterium]
MASHFEIKREFPGVCAQQRWDGICSVTVQIRFDGSKKADVLRSSKQARGDSASERKIANSLVESYGLRDLLHC